MGKVLDDASVNASVALADGNVLEQALATLTRSLEANFDSLDDYMATLAFVNVAFFYHKHGQCSLDEETLEPLLNHLQGAYWASENTLTKLLLACLTEEGDFDPSLHVGYFETEHASSLASYTPDLSFLMKLAIMLDIVGRRRGVESLVYKAYSLIKALAPILEASSSALNASLNRSSSAPFLERQVLAKLALVLYKADSYQDRAERASSLKASLDSQTLTPLLTFIFCLLEEEAFCQASFEVPSFDNAKGVREELGIALYQSPVFDGALFSKGAHISLGFLHKAGTQIAAMGPLKGALDQMESFGMYRHADTYPSLEFWSHMVEQRQKGVIPTSNSLFFALREQDEQSLTLHTYLDKNEGQEPTFFAFFVKAQALLVGGQKVERQAVQGFCGPASEIHFIGGEGMKWAFSEEIELYVAPLPCKDFFWEASFLIAYRLETVKRSFKIEIR